MSESEDEEPKIEKGIPIPPRYNGEQRWTNLMSKMEPGDSFLVSFDEDRKAILMAARRAGFNVLTRKMPGEGYRVWRVGKRILKS